jgi:hypothetical protein
MRNEQAVAVRESPGPEALRDERFQSLLAPEDWASLPAPVRRRFSVRLGNAQSVVYVGEVAETRVSLAGRAFAQLARLIGAPLPFESGGRTASAVMVAEDEQIGGQLWTRVYAREGQFPQVIHSAKRFDGPTGIEECVRFGVGMALTIHVESRALVFRSAHYFARIAGRRLRIPHWLTPGELEVVHREERDGRFSFTLTVRHRLFGEIIRQIAFFRDAPPV